MNRLRHALGRDERGQILVIVAGGMIALLAIAALALEGGTLLLNRRDAQNGADLASVAGTREVALKYVDTATVRVQSNVFAAVNKSLIANGCVAADGCTWTGEFADGSLTSLGAVNNSGAAIPANTVAVHVMVDKQVGAVIGHAIGFNSWTVSTEATVQGPQARRGASRAASCCRSPSVAGPIPSGTTARRRRRTRHPATSSTSRKGRSTT